MEGARGSLSRRRAPLAESVRVSGSICSEVDFRLGARLWSFHTTSADSSQKLRLDEGGYSPEAVMVFSVGGREPIHLRLIRNFLS